MAYYDPKPLTLAEIAAQGLSLSDCISRLDGTYDYCPTYGTGREASQRVPLSNPIWGDMFRPHGLGTYWVIRHPQSAP